MNEQIQPSEKPSEPKKDQPSWLRKNLARLGIGVAGAVAATGAVAGVAASGDEPKPKNPSIEAISDKPKIDIGEPMVQERNPDGTSGETVVRADPTLAEGTDYSTSSSSTTAPISQSPAAGNTTTSTTTAATPSTIPTIENATNQGAELNQEDIDRLASSLGQGFIDLYNQGIGDKNSQSDDGKITTVSNTAFGGDPGRRTGIVTKDENGKISSVTFQEIYGADDDPNQKIDSFTFSLNGTNYNVSRSMFGVEQAVTTDDSKILQTATGLLGDGPPLKNS